MTRRDAYWMVVATAALAIATIAWGERIGINGGQGWDGMDYAEWARDFPKAVHQGWNAYQAQRVLPSAIVYLLGGRDHAVGRFQVFDAVVLVAAAFAWTRIAARMAWSRAAAWAGFVAVFGSFAIARHALYYPALTDTLAFALGVTMTWAYLADRPIALWLVAVAGAVTWPSLPVVALALLVLRRKCIAELDARWIRPVATGVAAIVAIVTCALAVYYLNDPATCHASWTKHVPRELVWITVPCLAAWSGLAVYVLASRRRVWNVIAYARGLVDVRTALAVAGTIAVVVAQTWWIARVGTHGSGPTRDQFVCELTVEALRGPLWDLVHHVVYFGPILIVAIAAWRHVAATADAWGPGAMFALALTVALAIGSESRHWLHLFPFVVAATITATTSWWTPTRTLGFTALCLAWSKLWFPIRYDAVIDAYTWPNQRYFMQQGPWASDTTFAVHAVAVAITAGVLVVLHRRRPDGARMA